MQKIGGIGAVLNGLCNAPAYESFYDRTVFYGPHFDLPGEGPSPLGSSREILFSSQDHLDTEDYADLFGEIISKYNVDIVYAKRKLVSEFDAAKHALVDVVNVGITKMRREQVEAVKYFLWKEYGIKSHLYDNDWDYEQYVRIAGPFLEIIEKLYGSDAEFYYFAHEYMGVPSALSVLGSDKRHTTVFIAHEVTTARSLVEEHHGHDISFYNILGKAKSCKSLEQVFGSQEYHSRTELVKRAVNFDHIFAVGDHVKAEYEFLVPDVPAEKIQVVYNGVSSKSVDFERKQQSRSRIEQYIDTLFNFTPDAIFTHISRLVVSKAIWRDVALLECLDEIFDAQNLKGAYILLSTLVGTGRPSGDVFKMEREYGWPVLHHDGWPDLIGAEQDAYTQLQLFNAKSKAIKAVFINQFGFDRSRGGTRVPEDAEFSDLRFSSDAEIGLSIYEPFGIAQIETVPFGGISILSSSCGSARFLQEKFKGAPIKPFYVLDYIAAGKRMGYNALKALTIGRRTEMERQILSKHAKGIFEALPLTTAQRQQYLANAQKYACRISWEASAQGYVLGPNSSKRLAQPVCSAGGCSTS
jgi:hypothetical protein